MFRIIFFSVFSVFLFAGLSLPQDIPVNKEVKTKEFDIKSFSQNKELFFEECNKITPDSDTTFYAEGMFSRNLILYKDIMSIDIKSNKRRTWEGILVGSLTGLVTGLSTAPYLNKVLYGSSDQKEFGLFIEALVHYAVITSGLIITGAAIGGLFGYMSFYADNYDLTKYKPEQRKEKALRIFLRYSVNF